MNYPTSFLLSLHARLRLARCRPIWMHVLCCALAVGASGVEPSPAPVPSAVSSAQATPRLLIVARDANSLVVRYELNGVSHEKRLLLSESARDFRYCQFLDAPRIAIVARIGAGWTARYYYRVVPLDGQPGDLRPFQINGPAGDYPVLGIGPGAGGALIISAIRTDPNSNIPNDGWIYVDPTPLNEQPAENRGQLRWMKLPLAEPHREQNLHSAGREDAAQ